MLFFNDFGLLFLNGFSRLDGFLGSVVAGHHEEAGQSECKN
jgi:hypothetical protein